MHQDLQAVKAQLAVQDLLVLLDHKDRKDSRVVLVQLDQLDKLDLREQLDRLAHQDRLARQVQSVILALQEAQVHLV